MSKQVNYNENLCAGAAIRDDKGRRISKLFEASHPKMTVGYAKNLIMPDTPTEQEFNFRQAGGGVIEDGVAVIDKVKGKSIVWNQRVKNATFINTSEWDATYSTFSVSGGIASITASADGDNYTQQSVPMVVGHKYIYIFMAATDTANKNLACAYIFYGGRADFKVINAEDDTNWHIYNAIVTCVSNDLNIIRLEVTKAGTSQFKNISIIDLTQMFGAGNEPSTYEEFLSRKPKVADEFAYNEGTIVNNKVEKVKVTGVNLWDEEWENRSFDYVTGAPYSRPNSIGSRNYCEILSGKTYFAKISAKSRDANVAIFFYDAQKNFINYTISHGGEFTTPANAAYFRIYWEQEDTVAFYNHDVCINLSDPTINGQYFPYEKHELDLSWIKEIKDTEGVKLFEGGMKSVGTAFDEVGKNKAVRRLGSVDLGSLSYTKTSLDGQDCFEVYCSTLPQGLPIYGGYILSPIYSVNNTLSTDKTLATTRGSNVPEQYRWFFRNDTYVTAADFKAAMAGVKLYYELAEPIEVEYDEKNLTYPVVAGGTEEAIASEPSTAFRADIGYGIDAVKTILDLKARVEALEGK